MSMAWDQRTNVTGKCPHDKAERKSKRKDPTRIGRLTLGFARRVVSALRRSIGVVVMIFRHVSLTDRYMVPWSESMMDNVYIHPVATSDRPFENARLRDSGAMFCYTAIPRSGRPQISSAAYASSGKSSSAAH